MREELLGYLLGSLDAVQHQQVDRELERNPHLRRDLEVLRAKLRPLELIAVDYEPPQELVARTCQYVAAHREQSAVELSQQHASSLTSPRSNRWGLSDVVVAAGVIAAAAMLFFPAIANSRFNAQKAMCQNNLRQLGFALASYSQQHAQGRIPYVPTEGNRAVAGIYGPILNNAQMLPYPSVVICPSSTLVEELDSWQLPTLQQIDLAQGARLLLLQRWAGGSYGFNLGVMVEGRHRAPQFLGRAHFVLMSDAPSRHLEGGRSANHGGRGQNMLFEDNRVEYVVGRPVRNYQDDPFRNHRGFVEAGVDRDDSVVGDSITAPFTLSDIPMFTGQ